MSLHVQYLIKQLKKAVTYLLATVFYVDKFFVQFNKTRMMTAKV